MGKLYAPTWEMVTWLKRGIISPLLYEKQYYDLLQNRWAEDRWEFQSSTLKLVEIVTGTPDTPERDITFVCFCPAGAFCHRHLLVRWFCHNWPQIQYGGERHV